MAPSSSSSSKSDGAPTKLQLASATKPLSLTPLLTDLWLLDRLTYKSTYTTGRMSHMHKLAAVRRTLRRLSTHIRLDAALATILVHKPTVDPTDVAVFLKEWIKVSKLLPVIQRVARAASLALVAELGAGRYVAFCIVTVAILARVQRVAAVIAAEMRAPYVRFRIMLPTDIAKTLPISLDRQHLPPKSAGGRDLVDQSQVIDRSTFTASSSSTTPPPSSSPAPDADVAHDVAMDDIDTTPWVSTTDQTDAPMLDLAPPAAAAAKTKLKSKSKRPASLADSDDNDHDHDAPVPVVALDDLPSFFDPVPANAPAAKPPKKKARKSDADKEVEDVFGRMDAAGGGGKKGKSVGWGKAETKNKGKKVATKVKSKSGASKSVKAGKDEIDDLFGSLF